MNKRKCIFLDRDGTINKHKGLLFCQKDLELESGSGEAIRLINESNYLAIVVTNQSVIARGLCDIETLQKIHAKMRLLLAKEGAYVDDLIFCPHYPEEELSGGISEYMGICNCRKPAIGMIDKMVAKYQIDCAQSYMIGDSTIDIQTGINAGLHTIMVHTGVAGTDGRYEVRAEQEAENLLEAVQWILKRIK